MKKKKKQYKVTPLVKEEIRDYCKSLISLININFLEENNIYENEFLEYLYFSCEKLYLDEGGYELTEEEISYLVLQKKQIDNIGEELEKGNASFLGIDKKTDSLVFKFKNEKLKNKFLK